MDNYYIKDNGKYFRIEIEERGGGPVEYEIGRPPLGDGWRFIEVYDEERCGTSLCGIWRRDKNEIEINFCDIPEGEYIDGEVDK